MPAILPIQPRDLGFPPKFQSWRLHQDRAILNGLDSQRRFVAQAVPTGGGKSPAYVAQALLSGVRCAILTSTKGLQDQLLDDFAGIGLVDIRGRANYDCRLAPGMTCEDGAHVRCQHDGSGACAYYNAYARAANAPLVVTNYSYWVLVHKYGKGLGHFDMLVLDEAHNAPDEVCSVMSQSFSSEEILYTLQSDFPRAESPLPAWRIWAKTLLPRAEELRDRRAEFLRDRAATASLREIRELGRIKGLVTKLHVIASAQGDWIAEANPQKTGGYHLDPLWPAPYVEEILFRGIPRVLAVSATVLPKTCELLGIRPAELDFQQYPSTFPPERSPFYYIPTCRVDHRSMLKLDYVDLWVRRIDQIIAGRLDRRGIIHTVSYERKNLILSNSIYSEFMVAHVTRDAMRQAQYFKRLAPPAILLTPSMSTGYDFPYESCEYQILSKVPYPDTRSSIMQARTKADKSYGPYITAQQLVQSAGRAMRAKDDRVENFIIDDHIRGFIASQRDLLPPWFLKLYRRKETVPPAAPKLERRAVL